MTTVQDIAKLVASEPDDASYEQDLVRNTKLRLGIWPLVAHQLEDRRWVVRPLGQLGSIGWFPRPWTAQYVSAPTAEDAIRKAKDSVYDTHK